MATLKVLVLFVACLYVTAAPQEEPVSRNTIFGDERLEGGVFEHVDDFPVGIALFNEDNPYRLPTTTRPIHYNVIWHIDLEWLTYSGTVQINLAATQAGVTEIVIHTSHTELNSVVLTQGTNAVPQTYIIQEQYHFLRVTPTAALNYNADAPIVYTLTIQFGADMRNDMYGIYGSWFRNDPNGLVSWMATTQFQATAGRYAFPCYDEPSFKATFDITIRRPTTHRSWSCTRIENTIPSPGVAGFQDDIYHTTPIMSTYLLAIIVAEYDSIVEPEEGPLTYEVIARPGAIALGQGQYAFDVGQQLLAEMNDHTAYEFTSMNPNLKMTQAAIPDFGAGAMENWGLLTYREAYLMYDPDHTSGYFKQMIAYILSHEIAHMWFGNLVTCDWWDVLWLNEGFARYYQYFLTHWVEDYMGLETRFITEQVHTSLLTDSANNPQPLTNPGVGSPQQVSSMFGTISYNKGAAVIRMTEHLLGFDVHRAGLRNYLVAQSFDTALPIDLFEALQEAGVAAGALDEYPSDFSIVEYYRGWTERAGHPVLNVQVNHQTGQMFITQRRFNINTGYSNINTNWIVPITFATASNPDFANTKPTHIVRDSLAIINRGSIGDEWVIFNKQQTGFYRVNYDDYTWNLIVLALRGEDRTRIHEYNRAQIVNDVFQFARSGIMSYTRAFNILSFLEFETEYAPWVAAVTGFNWIRNRLVGTPHGEQLQQMIARWATRVMTEITYYHTPEEDFMRSYLRYQLAPTMCAMGVSACRIAATAQFQALRLNDIEVFPDNRQFVYCNALREGSIDDFDYLWDRFQQHQVYTEKITLLQSLGCTPHQTSLNQFLSAIVSDNQIIRPQDYTTAWNSAATGNEGNTDIVFEFIQNNMPLVFSGFNSYTTPLSYISSRLRTEDAVDRFQGWAYQNQLVLGSAFMPVFNGAESSRESIRWGAAVASDMNSYFLTGDETIETSTAGRVPPVEIVTEAQPQLIEPETPDLSEFS